MGKQIRRLTALQLCNFCGFNEFRHSKDRKKKSRYLLMGILWIFVILILLLYMAGIDITCVVLGMPKLIPLMSATIVCLVILFFSILKAGSTIFGMKDYEMLMALPMSKQAIIISRFLTMYVNNLGLGTLVMLPGIIIYAVAVRPGVLYYIFIVLGTLLLPLLPITIATLIGAGITAISARMKHKSLISGLLTVLIGLAAVIFSMKLQTINLNISEQDVENLAETISAQIGKMYPPAMWLTDAVTDGSILKFLLFAGVSFAAFVVMVSLVSHYFVKISDALRAKESGKSADIHKVKVNSVLKALYKKEWKRFLASGVYVSNAAIGDALMVVLAVALYFAGVGKTESLLQLQGILSRIYPYALCFMMAVMPTTVIAFSMEGRQWWLTKSLPVRNKDIINSKILVNLTLAFPCYVIAEIFSCMAIKTDVSGYISLILIPLVFMIFSSVSGLAINLIFPVFDWENEAKVVKQSAALMVSMLVNIILVVIPAIVSLALHQVPQIFSAVLVMIIWLILAIVLYQLILKKDFRAID